MIRKFAWFAVILLALGPTMSGCASDGNDVAGGAATTAPETISPPLARMLGAMPEGAESVLLVDRAKLTALGAPAALLLDALILDATPGSSATTPPTTRQRIGRAIGMAGVTHFALGASKFQFPEDLGVGGFTERWIFVVEGPTGALRSELDALVAAAKADVSEAEGLRVYETMIDPIGEGYNARGPDKPFFIAVLDDCAVIAAESRRELSVMAAAMRAEAPAIAPRWAGPASRLRPGGALAIVRVYDPTSVDRLSPVNPECPYADVESIAVSLLDDGVTLGLNVRTTERTQAIRFYEELLPREAFAWHHEGGGRHGFSARVGAHQTIDSRFAATMSVFALFGINFVI